MPRPPKGQWKEFPNITGVASTVLPLMSSVLFGFGATIIAVALDNDFVELELGAGLDTREIVLIGGSLSLISFLVSIAASMYCHALDYRDLQLEDWVGEGADDDAREDCQKRALTYFLWAIVLFYAGLFVLFSTAAAVTLKIHLAPGILLSLGAIGAALALLKILKSEWRVLKGS